jgi:cytoskeletal protein RodZ
VPDVEPLQQDTAHLDSAHPEQVAATRVTTVGSSPIMDRAPKGRGEGRSQVQPPQQSQSIQPSMVKLVLVAAAVSLICGVIGAVGYTHFFAPTPRDASSSQSQTHVGSNSESKSTRSGGTPAAKPTAQPASGAVNVEDEAIQLKQQITSLNQRIERLGEKVDRLQELLSLAVPLLQRIAPKH